MFSPTLVNVSLTWGKPSQIDCTPEAGVHCVTGTVGGLPVPPLSLASGQRHHSAGVGTAASSAPARGKLRPSAESDSPTVKALSPWLNLL